MTKVRTTEKLYVKSPDGTKLVKAHRPYKVGDLVFTQTGGFGSEGKIVGFLPKPANKYKFVRITLHEVAIIELTGRTR